MDEARLYRILEEFIRATQGNFDHLSGEAREYARLFNRLSQDVEFLYEALGIENDSGTDDQEPSSTVNFESPEHTHPAAEVEISGINIPLYFGGDGEDGPPGAPGRDGVAGAQGADGVTTTLQGVPGMPGEDAEPFIVYPGAQGAAGTEGTAGATGAAGRDGLIAWPGPDGEEGIVYPGPAGPAGAPGAGASTTYAPGAFTTATGNFRLHVKRLELTSSQRGTLEGTSRLRIV